MAATRPHPMLDRRAWIAGCAAAFAGARASAGARPIDRIEGALRPVVSQAVTEGRAPGCSAAVLLDDQTMVTCVAGWADPDLHAPMTPATRMMSGSTGKTFCAATCMSLVSEGRLSLDAPIAPIFADEPWYKRLPNAPDLTLRILLMHRAGFPQFLDLADFQSEYLLDSLTGRDVGYSPRKMLSFILGHKPLFPAGHGYHYSDLEYHLVGLTMEKVTGKSYYALLAERVLSKLPTRDIIPSNTPNLPGLAAGYARGDLIQALAGNTGKTTDRPGHLRKNPALEYTGGGLALTPRSLALFYSRLANGEIIPRAAFAEMLASSTFVPTTTPGVDNRYGLGVEITTRPLFGRYINHSGYFPGYNANVAYYFDHGFAAAVQVNTDHGPDIYDLLRSVAKAVISA
ncbi:MAG TPA: serine hydrolase domain-containing protein [Caulobacteraceae bacterium]|nr:serine hydrolase domain-containing protein [Caulobacteraceae bacterium]